MKSNKLWSIVAILITCLSSNIFLTSCGDNDDDIATPNEGTVSIAIKNKLNRDCMVVTEYSGDRSQVTRIGIKYGKTTKVSDGDKGYTGSSSYYDFTYHSALNSTTYFQGYVTLKNKKTIKSNVCKLTY